MSGTGWAGLEGFKPEVRHGAGNPEAQKWGARYASPEYVAALSWRTRVEDFMRIAEPQPGSHVLDLGCGLGLSGLALMVAGLKVTLVDFVRNSLEVSVQEAILAQPNEIRFVKADLEHPLPVTAQYGYCASVLEHIPEDSLGLVLKHIFAATQESFYAVMLDDLRPHEWWVSVFVGQEHGSLWAPSAQDNTALFYVSPRAIVK